MIVVNLIFHTIFADKISGVAGSDKAVLAFDMTTGVHNCFLSRPFVFPPRVLTMFYLIVLRK